MTPAERLHRLAEGYEERQAGAEKHWQTEYNGEYQLGEAMIPIKGKRLHEQMIQIACGMAENGKFRAQHLVLNGDKRFLHLDKRAAEYAIELLKAGGFVTQLIVDYENEYWIEVSW